MKVTKRRWGEVTIKKQGDAGKNCFDATKSFSVDESGNTYTIEEYKVILEMITDLTTRYDYSQLAAMLKNLEK